jgi:glucose-6-phosphate isomerase
MRLLLYDKAFARRAHPGQELYYMHRAAHNPRDEQKFKRHHIRYDITIFPPGTLGKELNKTAGHYHPPAVRKPFLTFPEVYEVLSGEALFLLQRRENAKALKPVEAALVRVKAGEKLLVPPNWGHISINAKPKHTLIEANLVCPEFKSDYEPYRKMRGGSHYILADGSVVPNSRYGKVPYRVTRAKEWNPAWLNVRKSIYELFLERPRKFEFLRDPKKK